MLMEVVLKNNRLASLALFLLFFSLFIVGCSPAAARPGDQTLEALGFRVIPPDAEFPDIQFADIDGGSQKISDYQGSVILLNFWASWCPPCRAEMPAMEKLASELDGNDFVMIPINVQEPVDLVQSFVKEFDIGFPVYMDINADAAKEVGVSGLPTSILIDREGNAIAVVTGAIEWDSLEMIEMMQDWTR